VLGLTAFLLMLFFLAKQATVSNRHLGLLAIPVLVYMFVGPVGPMLWDRWIWSMAALALLVPAYVDPEDEDVGADTQVTGVQGRWRGHRLAAMPPLGQQLQLPGVPSSIVASGPWSSDRPGVPGATALWDGRSPRGY
jgi:hypothetical protein